MPNLPKFFMVSSFSLENRKKKKKKNSRYYFSKYVPREKLDFSSDSELFPVQNKNFKNVLIFRHIFSSLFYMFFMRFACFLFLSGSKKVNLSEHKRICIRRKKIEIEIDEKERIPQTSVTLLDKLRLLRSLRHEKFMFSYCL